ncbi:MAG TPA: carbohydrate porin [Candidatus Methylomirabilis sp.]|nr:carbohydrate porin [Candidatus Methylomirabilis sp.]
MGAALVLVLLVVNVSRANPSLTVARETIEEESRDAPAPMGAQSESNPLPGQASAAPDDEGDKVWSVRCPTPAHPHRLHIECIGKPFDFVADTLSRDWAGFRAELAEFGIIPTAGYATQLMGNPSGGKSQGFTYAAAFDMLVAVDLHKLLGVPGLSFNVGASWLTGQSLSTEDIGNVFGVQSVFSGSETISLQQMFFQQQLFGGALTIAAGRLAPANAFAILPVSGNYFSAGINPVPESLSLNDGAFAQSPPGVEWGAQAIYQPIPKVEVSVGIYNTNPNAAAGNKHGVDFALQQGNRGVLTVAQVDYLVNQTQNATGMPGQYTIGGFYDSNTFSSLSNPGASVSNNWAVYAMFQQMVFRDGGPGSQKGLTVWGELALSNKASVSLIPYFWGGGLSYEGLITARASDIASLGVITGRFSRHVPNASSETVIEANYQVTLTSWLSVTPDFQYVIRPSGTGRIKNAVVLGLQVAVTF